MARKVKEEVCEILGQSDIVEFQADYKESKEGG